MVSNKTKEFVTVALTGDGGDEVLVVIISTILGN
jgi:asparagine synthetase B (glutamine-hydrolysing)